MRLTYKQIKEKLELTTKQKEALKELDRALKKLKKSGAVLWGNLDALYAVNGKIAESVLPDKDRGGIEIGYENTLEVYDFNPAFIRWIETYADDTHWIKLKDGIEIED